MFHNFLDDLASVQWLDCHYFIFNTHAKTDSAYKFFTCLSLDLISLNKSMKSLYYNYDVFTRPFNQYGSLAQASLNLGAPVDLGYHWEDANNSTKLYKTLHKIVKNGKIESPMGEYAIFKNLRFPIINFSKEDMLQYANDHNFGDILHHTWSCWHPKNGKPCGTCPMCMERII